METLTKKCTNCESIKPLKEFWGQQYDDGMFYFSIRCNRCSGKLAYTPLLKAKQQYFYLLECLVGYGINSRSEAARIFEFNNDDAQVICSEKIKQGFRIDMQEAETIWYNRKNNTLQKRISRFAKSGRKYKPREAHRAPGRTRGDAKAWLESDEPYVMEGRKKRASRAKRF